MTQTKPTIETNRPTGGVVTAAEWNSQVLQNGQYLQEVVGGLNPDKIPNAALGPDTARLNLLTNSGLDTWQRGTGPFSGLGTFTADRWKISVGSGDSMTVSADTLNAINGSTGSTNYCAVCTVTHTAGGGGGFLMQPLDEQAQGLRGLTITASIMVKSSQAGLVMSIGDSGGSANSNAHSGSGNYERLTATYTVTSTATGMSMQIGVPANVAAATYTFYVDNATLAMGSQPMVWQPLHPSDHLERCQRYYTKGYYDCGFSPGGAGHKTTLWVPFRGDMATYPTITITAGVRTDVASVTVNQVQAYGFRVDVTATATGNLTIYDESYIAEANP